MVRRKNSKLWYALAACLIAGIFMMTGCPSPTGGDPIDNGGGGNNGGGGTTPSAPANIVIEQEERTFTIYWDAVPDAEWYKIYQSTSETGTYSHKYTVQSFSIDKNAPRVSKATTAFYPMDEGKTFYFRVSVQVNGKEYKSDPISKELKSLSTPATPASVTLTAVSDSAIQVNWTAGTSSASRPAAVKYSIWYGTSATAQNTKAGEVNGSTLTYTVSGLLDKTTYYFTVKAHAEDGGISTKLGPTAGATTQTAASVPAKVTGLDSAPGFVLTWDPIDRVHGYIVERSDNQNFTGTVYKTDLITRNSTTLDGLKTATTYYFRVKAVNGKGEGHVSDWEAFMWLD